METKAEKLRGFAHVQKRESGFTGQRMMEPPSRRKGGRAQRRWMW